MVCPTPLEDARVAFGMPGIAVGAFERFGKGMGHRAQRNFGDCAVYGLAAMRGEPLLATGNDFAATDLTVIGPTSGSCGGTRADGV